MREQLWVISVRYRPEGARDLRRCAVVGPARASTVEAVLHLAGIPEAMRAELRADALVRKFVEGALDPETSGYYAPCPLVAAADWIVCVGSIQAVMS